MDACLDAGDEIELPGAPLDLPDTERRETRDAEQRQRDQQRAFQGCMPASAVGVVIGIILVLRWYMIHSDPAITISTITPVKT